jgi:hypothetical protein
VRDSLRRPGSAQSVCHMRKSTLVWILIPSPPCLKGRAIKLLSGISDKRIYIKMEHTVGGCLFLTKPPLREPGMEGYKRRISAFPFFQSFSSAMLFTKIASALILFTLSASACSQASDCDIGCSRNPAYPVTSCQE